MCSLPVDLAPEPELAGAANADEMLSCVRVTNDTSPFAEAVMLEHLRRMTPRQRLHRACELRAATLTLARARIRRWYGSPSEREIRLRLAALWLDRETMRLVYGWDPQVEGL